MDKELRNSLRNTVTKCRKLLEDAVGELLEGQFGIHRSGKIEDATHLNHLAARDQEYRAQVLAHFEHIKAAGFKPADAMAQLIREIAFTHLNRLCAYKMMEKRGLIRESVSRGLKSQGVNFHLAEHPEDEKLWDGGKQDVAYRHFLEAIGARFADEIPILFSPHDPANRLFPPQRVLDEVLELINADALQDIWTEDETIGWIYQYFTPKELRDQARKESAAPRNSYELAFRNQFFTPRYVVRFLGDNTLGQIWYEMMQGQTKLVGKCEYMVRRPNEVWLKEGENPPVEEPGTKNEERSQEELLRQPVYILFRPKKDPRDIKILDPAEGSGHFLLYGFDLMEVIYREAWDDPDLGKRLKADFQSLEVYRRQIPELILRHNLHGIDIDLRAVQIAALALWLRAQRAWQEMGIPAAERPGITKSNLVCAEPMPGEAELLEEFVATLQPRVLGQLVRVVFDKMKLAGEAGSLLKIEEELRDAIAAAKKQWLDGPKREQMELFASPAKPQQEELRFDIGGVTDEQFWSEAEGKVVNALQDYAQAASKAAGYSRRLFAEDAVRGFAYVDICRLRFDVVLMNPPFGSFSKLWAAESKLIYPDSSNDILGAFVDRFLLQLHERGRLGAITSRTCFFLTSFTDWRTKVVLKKSAVHVIADLGQGVMDEAMVEAASYVLERTLPTRRMTVFRAIADLEREQTLNSCVRAFNRAEVCDRTFMPRQANFALLPDSPFVYWVESSTIEKFSTGRRFEPDVGSVRVGLQTGDDPRFIRAVWEVAPEDTIFCYYPINGDAFCSFDDPMIQAFFRRRVRGTPRWAFHVKSGSSQPWYAPITLKLDYAGDGADLRNFKDDRGKPKAYLRSQLQYYRPGFSWTLRAARFYPYVIPGGCIPSVSRYMAFPDHDKKSEAVAVCASRVATAFMRFYGEKFEFPKFLVDTLKLLPWPDIPGDYSAKLAAIIDAEVCARRAAYQNHEPFHEFLLPAKIRDFGRCGSALAFSPESLLGEEVERELAELYGFTESEQKALNRDLQEALAYRSLGKDTESDQDGEDEDDGKDFVLDCSPEATDQAHISYLVGVVVGRWDVRLSIGARQPPVLPHPFLPLPVCPPGMLQDDTGLPARPADVAGDYPVAIDWDGILVDDEEHPDDITRRVRDALAAIWKDRAEAIEQEACEILGVKDLRDYFRKPGNGGFWRDHVNRYSKSRRKAPIYWLLQSAGKNYALWIYYHRLDKDLLFKALVKYVEPKLKLERDRLEQCRNELLAAGSSGRSAKALERRLADQEDLLSDIQDFHDKLRRAADLRLDPDLNDGVVLNIAPLWELVPWKEAKSYWDELMAGEYEWSSVGKQLRAKGLVK